MLTYTTSQPPCYDKLFQVTPGLYLVLTADFIVVDATDKYLLTTLTTREQIVGKCIFDVFPDNPDNPAHPALHSAQALEASLRYVLQHKQPHSMPAIQYDIIDRTSPNHPFVERYWSFTNFPVLDENQQVCYIMHEKYDITALTQLQEGQHSIKEHLSLLQDAVSAVHWEHDLVHDTINWGNGVAAILGYTPEEMGTSLESWTARIHPDDLQKTVTSLLKAIGNKMWSEEYRFRKASGAYAYMLDQGFFVYKHGKAVKLVGSMVDVTANRQVEQALKESDTRFLTLLESLPLMAWTADTRGKVLYFNQSWYNYTGMKPGQTDGWINVVHPEDSPQVLSEWAEAMNTGFYQVEYRVRSYLDGTFRWFLEQGVPLRDETGKILLWMGTYTDIDDQKQPLVKI
ncbi:PAS domain-containing protein [Pontibacter chitinilyticus]|uniref:PAS domain-containing protein n=1 Tax=Pontibacter chitinilyticus TaxID=2674989 RepID=UPI003219E27F